MIFEKHLTLKSIITFLLLLLLVVIMQKKFFSYIQGDIIDKFLQNSNNYCDVEYINCNNYFNLILNIVIIDYKYFNFNFLLYKNNYIFFLIKYNLIIIECYTMKIHIISILKVLFKNLTYLPSLLILYV